MCEYSTLCGHGEDHWGQLCGLQSDVRDDFNDYLSVFPSSPFTVRFLFAFLFFFGDDNRRDDMESVCILGLVIYQ
jgi:hypothetical protein